MITIFKGVSKIETPYINLAGALLLNSNLNYFCCISINKKVMEQLFGVKCKLKSKEETERKAVKDLAASVADIMNVPEHAIFVFLKENESDNVGVGGKLLSELK
ncbi:MAG: hypothetical protein H6Q74_2473, partial [Firmicutes bacterium]|nr:hypothetical protein [Bacillota bacterium]